MNFILKTASIIAASIIAEVGSFGLHAQTDSLSVEYSEEDAKSSDFEYRKEYQYVDINKKEERRLFKIAYTLSDPAFNIFKNFNTTYLDFVYELAIEQKIGTQWSVMLVSKNRNVPILESYYDFSCRYYPFKIKQIQSGESSNNLNGLYVESRFENLINFDTSNDDNKILDLSQIGVCASVGLQKRLNNWAYIDCGIDAAYNHAKSLFVYRNNVDWYLGVNLKIGFAWSVLNKRK